MVGKWVISKCLGGDGTFLISGKRNILCPGNDFIHWESDHLYSMGSGQLILWDSGILGDTGHWKWTILSSRIRTTYPLGNVLCSKTLFGKRFFNLVWVHNLGTAWNPFQIWRQYFVLTSGTIPQFFFLFKMAL